LTTWHCILVPNEQKLTLQTVMFGDFVHWVHDSQNLIIFMMQSYFSKKTTFI